MTFLLAGSAGEFRHCVTIFPMLPPYRERPAAILPAPAAFFLALASVYLLLASPHLTGGDCGEYVGCSRWLGNNHPPGNPFYDLLGYVAQQLPAGDLFSRTAILSALPMAGAVALLSLPLPGVPGTAARPVPLLVLLLLAFSPSVLRTATMVEVYGLATFALAFILRYAFRAAPPPLPAAVRRASFLTGLAMGVHYLVFVAALPAGVRAILQGDRKLRAATAAFLSLVLGYLVFLYLPARGSAAPPWNFGAPSGAADFLGILFWKQYAGRPAHDRTASLLLRQSLWTCEALLRSFHPAVLSLAFMGLAARGRPTEGRDPSGILALSVLWYSL
ncbi:MAG TPA: DUF2723 domain-containing protein, partial [Candidatus Deferrimicrobiaceae bacterium]